MRFRNLLRQQEKGMVIYAAVVALIPLIMITFYIMFWIPLALKTYVAHGLPPYPYVDLAVGFSARIYKYITQNWLTRMVGICIFVVLFIALTLGQILAGRKKWIIAAVWLLLVGTIILFTTTVFTLNLWSILRYPFP